MLRRIVGDHKSNLHHILFSSLWDYRNSVKISQLVYGLEAVLPVQCQIPSLKLAVELLPDTSAEEEISLYLNKIDETQRDDALANEAHKKCVKA